MKIMLCGPISSRPKTFRTAFAEAEKKMTEYAHLHGEEACIFNPAILPQSKDVSPGDYLGITSSMIDACDTVFFLKGWEQSEGARTEMDYCMMMKKHILSEV